MLPFVITSETPVISHITRCTAFFNNHNYLKLAINNCISTFSIFYASMLQLIKKDRLQSCPVFQQLVIFSTDVPFQMLSIQGVQRLLFNIAMVINIVWKQRRAKTARKMCAPMMSKCLRRRLVFIHRKGPTKVTSRKQA